MMEDVMFGFWVLVIFILLALGVKMFMNKTKAVQI